MAIDNCTYKNPLKRDGVSQKQRLPEALDPDYVKVDEQSLADLLRFVNRYARLLQYYKPDNTPVGNWRPFFEKDVTSVIVMLTEENPSGFIECLDESEEVIQDTSSSYVEVRKAFKTMFDISATLAVEVDRWFRQSEKGFEFNAHLERLITSELRPALTKLTGFYKGALIGTPLLIEDFTSPGEKCGRELISFAELATYPMDKIWIDPAVKDESITIWPSFYDSVERNTSVYQTDSSAVKARIQEGFPVIRELVRSFISAIQTTKQRVPEFVEQTLESFSAHEPHMGLLLSFFKLFSRAQDQINTISRRHLNFYYEKVLQLARNDAVADQVHLCVELAKHVDNYKIDEGILFKAGKDREGNEVLYRANEEVVLNKARVEQLKTVFIDKADRHRVYDKQIANSKDGTGKELDNPSEGWKVFGESQLVNREEGNNEYRAPGELTMQFSNVGFAIASPLLELAEGKRSITIDITCVNDFIGFEEGGLAEDEEYSDLLQFYATGPEGWINLQDFETTPKLKRQGSKYSIELNVIREIPSIIGFDNELHGAGFQTKRPILKVVLANNQDTEPYAYHFLRNKKVEKLEVSVSVTGMKNVIIQNDFGPIDPAKPFQPFGPAPAQGSAFYVGSREIFSKHLDSLSMDVWWHEFPKEELSNYYNYDANGTIISAKSSSRTPLSNSDFRADLEILKNGSWQLVKSNINIFPNQLKESYELIKQTWSGSGADDDTNNLAIGWKPDFERFSEFIVNLERGFVRLQLSSPQSAFGHKFYPRLLMQQLQNDGDIPVEPYTPKIKSLSLDYSAGIVLSNKSEEAHTGDDQFYHLYPFGTEKVIENSERLEKDLYLLPRFSHDGEIGEIQHEGEFYVGISDLQPPQQISLLVKMSEGSGDPSLKPPGINWFYLSQTGWIPFKTADIVKDSTNGLLDTGILRFNIPVDATSDSTRLPGNIHWIKAAINKNSAALSRIIDIHAQALSASFRHHGNTPDFLSSILPASTISKLKEKQPEVKKINQPYASENGKPAEEDREYYRRINERLRHKDRGITVWDYERLVLQQFPSLYKAKCINHSSYGLEMNGNKMDAEFAPGYVTIVVVPDLNNKKSFNLLEPRVSLNLLEEISCFLKKKISLFAAENLTVINPYFEQIQLAFNVEFTTGKDEGFYRKKLVEDIIAFLSPWAFKEGEDIEFGGSIHKSVILNFVEERPYVDYVTDFKMHHLIKGTVKEQNVNEIEASQARSVLVSYHTHNINGQAIQVQ